MTTSIPARTAEMNVAQALKSASDRFRIVRDAADPTFKAASEQDYNSFRGEMLHVENLLGLTTSRQSNIREPLAEAGQGVRGTNDRRTQNLKE